MKSKVRMIHHSPSYTRKNITRLLSLALLLMLHTRNNTDSNKLVIFSSIALYYGDTCILSCNPSNEHACPACCQHNNCITHILRGGGNTVGVAWAVGLRLVGFVSGAPVTAAGLKPKLEISWTGWRRGRRHGQRCRGHE